MRSSSVGIWTLVSIIVAAVIASQGHLGAAVIVAILGAILAPYLKGDSE
jgi:cell division protein FtsW (lipid II flippase)